MTAPFNLRPELPISPLMAGEDRRRTERLMLSVPIRVLDFGSSNGAFSEDTHTVEVNRAGARIALKHRVVSDDTLRIVNLENFREADFRVVGATRLAAEEGREWGVECLDEGRNIWGIDFPPPLLSSDSQASALLRCRGCGKQRLTVLSFMEVDILESTGVIQQPCKDCAQFSSWSYAEHPQPAGDRPPSPQAPPPVEEWDKKTDRRAHKRLPLKMPILVRNQKGEQEISKTENVSKGGFSVCLALNLAVGELVKAVCPYTYGSTGMEQRAEVRNRKPFTARDRWLYGCRYVS